MKPEDGLARAGHDGGAAADAELADVVFAPAYSGGTDGGRCALENGAGVVAAGADGEDAGGEGGHGDGLADVDGGAACVGRPVAGLAEVVAVKWMSIARLMTPRIEICECWKMQETFDGRAACDESWCNCIRRRRIIELLALLHIDVKRADISPSPAADRAPRHEDARVEGHGGAQARGGGEDERGGGEKAEGGYHAAALGVEQDAVRRDGCSKTGCGVGNGLVPAACSVVKMRVASQGRQFTGLHKTTSKMKPKYSLQRLLHTPHP